VERSDTKVGRCNTGGIISLAQFVNEHGEALNYDLLTRTNYQLDDVGGALSWGALNSFIKHLGSDSALARDLGKATGWEDTLKTNAILADIYDLLQVINANIVAMGGGRHKQKITPYPRPGKGAENKRQLGKGALPLSELREWIRRRSHGGKN